MSETLHRTDAPGDAELISAVRGGDVLAYGELFERHVEAARRLARQLVSHGDVDDLVSDAFAKVLGVLQRGGGPDVAFRAYLLTAVRRLHVDRIRAGSRLTTTDDLTPFDPGVPFRDTAVEGFENAAAAKAFASLPERWQLVLWHTEVEGAKPAEVAALLGMSANSVSALAYRAREGLRQAFLNMHVQELDEDTCRWTHEHVGAYVRKAVSKRDATKVEEHLDDCRKCMAIYLELTEVNSNLSGILAPLLLGSAGAAYLTATGAVIGKAGLLGIAGRVRDAVTGGGSSSGGAGAGAGAAGAGAGAGGVMGAAGALGTLGVVVAGGAAVVAVAVGGVMAVNAITGRNDSPPSAGDQVGRPGAPLDGSTPGIDPETGLPSAAPTDGATDAPTDAPTDGLTDTPTDGVTDVPTDGTTDGTIAPGTDPVVDPGTDPGTSPGTDPGPGTGPGTDPGTGAPTPGEDVLPDSDGGPVTLDLLANDAGTGDLTLVSVGNPAHGTVQIGGPVSVRSGAAGSSGAGIPAAFLKAAQGPGIVTYVPDRRFKGRDSFTYVVASPSGDTSQGVARVTVVNGAPVARPDEQATGTNKDSTFGVLGNDTDPNGDDLAVRDHTGANHGSVTIEADGRLTYAPDRGYKGPDHFLYTAADGDGGSDQARVDLTVRNAAPVARADSAETDRNTSVDITVLDRDTDANGDTLEVTGFDRTTSQGGSVTGPGNVLTYTPARDFKGKDTFRYTISDGDGGTDSATVTVVVGNVAPVAQDDKVSTPSGTRVDIDVLGNDTDANKNDVLSIVGVPRAAHGRVSVAADGTLTYTPYDKVFKGDDAFDYTVTDGDLTDTGTVTVTVLNAAPVAVDDAAATGTNTAVTIDVLGNDSDPNGDDLALKGVGVADHGNVTVNDDGTLTYTPTKGYMGRDSFTYTISDGSDTATATVRVTTRNAAPDADDKTAVTDAAAPVDVTLSATDPNTDDTTFTFALATGPSHGSVTIVGDLATYTPARGYKGSDSFSYTATDAEGATGAPGRVTVSVRNAAPVAVDDVAATGTNTAVTINVLGNDSDPNGDPLKVTGATKSADGNVTVNDDGTITYKPTKGYKGADAFYYTISDGTDTATATVRVSTRNAAPVAVDDAATTDRYQKVAVDVLTNDSDPNGDPLSITAYDATSASGGSVRLDGGRLVYTPPRPRFRGDDTFTYTISDGDGGTATATVTVTVRNEAPVAGDDSAVTGNAQPVSIDVLGNDSDGNGDPLTVSVATGPGHGSAVVEADGTITYTPDARFKGADSFTYAVSDGAGGRATATVSVKVRNGAPVAGDDKASTDTGTATRITVLGNDSDPNGDTLTVTGASAPAHGTATVGAAGLAVTYTPNPRYKGDDSFTYTISDGDGGLATATVTVTVRNGAPDAADDSAATDTGTPVDIAVLGNDSDPNGDPLSVTGTTTPAHGSVSVGAGGVVTFTPDARWKGTDTFDYTVSDGDGGSATATVSVRVRNAAPVVTDESASLTSGSVQVPVLDNDTDPNGDTLSIASFDSTTTHGGHVTQQGTHLTYTPADGFHGTDRVTYFVTDGEDRTQGVLTVDVGNEGPAAQDDTPTFAAGAKGTATIDVTGNDTDPNGDVLTVTDVTAPGTGSTRITDNKVVFSYPGDFAGTETFDYTVSDGFGGRDTATVTVRITNDAPVAVTDTVSARRGTALTVDVLDNDTDPNGDTLRLSAVAAAAHGTTAIANGRVVYTPAAGFSGKDTFTYTVADTRGGSSTGTVNITVRALELTARDEAPDSSNQHKLWADVSGIPAGSVGSLVVKVTGIGTVNGQVPDNCERTVNVLTATWTCDVTGGKDGNASVGAFRFNSSFWGATFTFKVDGDTVTASLP